MGDTGAAKDRMIIIDALEFGVWTRERFEQWRTAGIGCVHITLAIWENARDTLSVIGEWNRLFDDHGDLIALATTAEEIEQISASGRTAIVYGFQNASPFEDDLELVRIFHRLGVRVVQLTYNVQNHVACGCWEDPDTGLSKHFGRNVVTEMNRVGMLVDLSHCGERTTLETIDYSAKPVAVTHANPTEFVGADIELKKRTKSTEIIRNLAARGGVIGLGMYPRMMRGGSNSTLEDFTDMVAWTVELAGIDAVGFGTDFYGGYPDNIITWWRAGRWARESPIPISGGLAEWPTWFRTPASFPGVLEAIQKKGFSDSEMAKLAGGNWLRMFGDTFEPDA